MTEEHDNRPPDASALEHEAYGWVVRFISGDAGAKEIEALKEWAARSPEHAQAFDQACKVEKTLSEALLRSAPLNVAARTGTIGTSPASTPSRIGRRAVLGGALAASAAGAAYLAARPPLGLWPSVRELAADYRTGIGRQRQLMLADTVSVEMNTQTSVSTRSVRAAVAAIEVISGEVAVAAKSPIVVLAGDGQTRAQQGVFDLRSNAENTVSVVCLDGEAQVSCGGGEVTLRPGQRVVYDRSGLKGVSSVNATSVAAWQRGLLIFEEEPLSEVVAEINRYRPGRVILMNGAFGTLPVDATFRLDRIDEAPFRLADVFELKTRVLPGGIVLLG